MLVIVPPIIRIATAIKVDRIIGKVAAKMTETVVATAYRYKKTYR